MALQGKRFHSVGISSVLGKNLSGIPFLKVSVADNSVYALVDTGSLDISVISESFWNSLQCDSNFSCELEHSDLQPASVSGSKLDVLGFCTLQLSLGVQIFSQRFYVLCDSVYPCILGLDFLHSAQAVIDLKNGFLKLPSENFPFAKDRPEFTAMKPVAVTLTESVIVHPHQGDFLQAKLGSPFVGGIGLFEPVLKLFDSQSPRHSISLLHAAREVVTVENDTIFVQVLNTGFSPIQLRAGAKLGLFHPEVEVIPVESSIVAGMHISESVENLVQLPPGVSFEASVSLTAEQKEKAVSLLSDYRDIFATSNYDVGRTKMAEHKIVTDGYPPKQCPYRIPEAQHSFVRESVGDMLQHKIIQPSSSPAASPIVLVKKKDGTWRFAIDYRKLNSITKKDAFPLPTIVDMLDHLGDAKFFSTLDANAGYWNVPIAEEDREKTAFVTYEGGLFEFLVLPFGLCNAPATYQRLMELVLAGVNWDFCLAYIDDVICFSRTFEEHLGHLRQIFDCFRGADLTQVERQKMFILLFKSEVLGSYYLFRWCFT